MAGATGLLGKGMGAMEGQGHTKRAVQVLGCVGSGVPCGVELPQPVGLVQKPRGPVLCAHCNAAGMHRTCLADWSFVRNHEIKCSPDFPLPYFQV